MTLVLMWDIDGTLLTTARAGIFAWEDAVREVLGGPVSLRDFRTAGLTDVEIARLLVRRHGPGGRAGDARLTQRLLRRYEELLPSRLRRRRGHVMPGVVEFLEHVRDRPDVVSMLLTGNTAAGARAKLEYYGLSPYFRRGAYADGTEDREAVARLALRLARQEVGPVPLERVYVIGDTPHDIACGKAIGARTVAVATGAYSLRQLLEHRPWWAVERLPAPEAFLSKLEGA